MAWARDSTTPRSTLGRLYGQGARRAIATLTLFGGFASTICWSLSAMLVSEFGWRNACLVYAAIHLVVLLPLYVFALPREAKGEEPVARQGAPADFAVDIDLPAPAPSKGLFALIALVITLSSIEVARFV